MILRFIIGFIIVIPIVAKEPIDTAKKNIAVLVKPLLDPESIPLSKPLESDITTGNKPTGETALRLQIFLDENNFGPGVIDGKPGLFTELAVQAWNEVHGHPMHDWTSVISAANKTISSPTTKVVVPDIIDQWVNPNLTNDRVAQSKVKRLSYRSIGELMAERYHTDIEYLIELNGAKNFGKLKKGTEILVPNIKPFKIEEIAGTIHKKNEKLAERHVVVDTRSNQARIFESSPAAIILDELPDGTVVPAKNKNANHGLIASFPITPGKKKFIHYGLWQVKTAVEFPGWTYDKSLLETGKRSKDRSKVFELPPGPNSPVGVVWVGLSKSGIGMHGTADPETIGRAQSAGCVRLANWDAIRLPTLISPGTSVEIR
jgi:lipoprotein-anchoring transpeptidase ErfK/SrfK